MTGRPFVGMRTFTEPQQGATYDDLLAVPRAAGDLGIDGFLRCDRCLPTGGGRVSWAQPS